MSEESEPSVRLLSYEDDQPLERRGSLIPGAGGTSTKRQFSPDGIATAKRVGVQATVVAAAVFALVLLSSVGYGVVSKANVASAPTVMVIDPYSQARSELEYGPQVALSKNNFFIETRDAFIDESMTFVEVDLTSSQLRYFAKGVLLQSAEIFSVAEEGTWWETPSGLYQIEEKEERAFTTIGQVYLPWQLTFQGNHLIHGQPQYPDGVEAESVSGGIRLSDESAQALFENVRVGTPVLVHAAVAERDTFVYEPVVPELDTPHYFIADIDNGTVLAASDLTAIAPIASLTKLMTAVVAAENITLDGRVRVTSPTFVTSLIPRLAERGSVSMYSLLQLLLIESSNEAAETIAGELGRDVFIDKMNDKARQLGMMRTTFADPSGLSADNVSSLGDLYRLTKYIHDNRSFVFAITTGENLPGVAVGDEFDGLVNFNEVEDMDTFAGGKVGETNAAGQTSISLHTLEFQGEERTLAVILLGSDQRTEDIEALLEYVEIRYGH